MLFCNSAVTPKYFLLKRLPALLSMADFLRLIEPLGILFLDTAPHLLKFLFQFLQSLNLVIFIV